MDWKIDLPEATPGENMVQCSFCNSSQVPTDQAFSNAEGKVFICHDCVKLGVSQGGGSVEEGGEGELEDPRSCSFCQRQEEFTEQILSAGDKTLYVCTRCLSDFAAQIPA